MNFTNLEKGQIVLMYNYELDELFLVKRGCTFGYFLLEDDHGTSFNKDHNEFLKSNNLLENSIEIDYNW